MSDLVLPGASPFDAIRHEDAEGEWWSARELMPLLGYDRWERFEDAITRAKRSAQNVGARVEHHFRAAAKVMNGGRWGSQRVSDYHLTRYGAYLVAMNGDVRKQQIADAQTYFAAKTREAETRPALPDLSTYEGQFAVIDMLRDQVERRQRAELEAAALKPDATSWRVLGSADGDYSVREAAYILNRDPNIDTGQNRLFKLLREWRLVDRRDRPYSEHAAHVTLRPQSYEDQVTGERVPAEPQVRITHRGLQYLHRRMGGVEPLNLEGHEPPEQPQLPPGGAA